MEAGGGSKRLMYTPHLKKVLKTYQASATNSLHGPNTVLGVWPGSESDDTPSVSPPSSTYPLPATDTAKDLASGSSDLSSALTKSKSSSSAAGSSKDIIDYDPFIAPPPFPIQQPPIFTPPDQSGCKKSETVLEGETISCFNVGGEERLCLPQILNSVLRDFSLQQINSVCDNLYIYCSRCNSAQLEVLKATRVLPFNAPSCGLITKTDAQRLCAALLDCNPPMFTKPDLKPAFQVPVYHECFGRCSGLYMPDLFLHPLDPCIECAECHGLLSPQKFVCHVHHPKETRTCHWGFDVFKWRSYIRLEIEVEENVQFQEALKEMKQRFDMMCKRKQVRKLDDCCSKIGLKKNADESCDPTSKKICTENCYSYPYAVDPVMVYYYGPHMWDNAFQTYPVITKDKKTNLYIPQDPHLIQKSLPNFRNRLSLTPANVQKLMPMIKLTEEQQTVLAYHAHKSETASKRSQVKKDPDQDPLSCCLDSDDTHSDTSFSTLSGTEDGLVSNIEEDEEFQQHSTDSEFLELRKILTDVDASLRTKIMSEVETLIAKYRKCLNVAVQGKKLYQMELEKLHFTQKEKLRKIREKNKLLKQEILKFQNNTKSTGEQCESQSSRLTPNFPSYSSMSPSSPAELEKITVTTETLSAGSVKTERSDEIDVNTEEENKTISVTPPTPSLPKLPLDPDTDTLCQ
ncbi:ski oncogene isoform X2 [Parasteatoda tepidariorum]|uniref:ski oncogene isoform X2 n=1 Tax=Parasteatoda tepidariorum TaxID=114398 RepID=UPI000A2C0DDD